MRIYAEHGAPERAARLRNVALTSDDRQAWLLAYDLLKYFDEVNWADNTRRTVYLNLLNLMVASADVKQTEDIFTEAMKWATENEDRELQAKLLLIGSRLDLRRQDLYRSRDRANDAVTMYQAMADQTQDEQTQTRYQLKQAEVLIHLAMIELNDGKPDAAITKAEEALACSDTPPIQAHSHFVRGMVAKRAKSMAKAVKQFKKANEIAGKIGQGPLALEAGLHLGESLLISGQHNKSSEVLNRVVQIAQSLRQPARERSATALLSQAKAAQKQFKDAIKAAERTLQLTRSMKFTRLEAVDLYNLGLFNFLGGNASEAVKIFRESEDKVDAENVGLRKELLFNMGHALVKTGDKSAAEDTLKQSLQPSTQAQDWRKVVAANRQLAGLAADRGERSAARDLLQTALNVANNRGLKDESKGIRKQLETL